MGILKVKDLDAHFGDNRTHDAPVILDIHHADGSGFLPYGIHQKVVLFALSSTTRQQQQQKFNEDQTSFH
jgi:hypothetical protein